MPEMTLNSGAKTVTAKVSDLQRDYRGVIETVLTGADVVLTRNGEQLVAMVDIERYVEAQNKAAKAEELARKVEQLQAELDLALMGGPSLETVRAEAVNQIGRSPKEAIAELRRLRGK